MILMTLFMWKGDKVSHSETEWMEILGQDRYKIMRQKGTEHAFIGEYVSAAARGVYCCAGCDLPLFLSQDKYDAGNGWPSFLKPINSKNVYYLEDWSLKFKRYEVLCSRCDGHLGHLFHDGPPPKSLRYTINSLSLMFQKKE